MLRFLPPTYIRQFQQYNYIPFGEVPASDFAFIQEKIKALQSPDPLVSVVLIAWNEQDFILATLASLAHSQVNFPMELIVVNNNSTDHTQDFIERCGAISVFEKRQGYAHARQAGLDAAKGKFIVSGDADTIYMPQWIEQLVAPLQKKEALCTYSLHAFYTDEQKYPPSLLLYQQAKYIGVLIKNAKRPHLNCGGASMAYVKQEATEVGGYNFEVDRGEDGTLAFEIGKRGSIKLVRSRKAMIYTNMRRTKMDGNLMAAFWKRFVYNMKFFTHYFSKQKTH